LSDRPEYIKSSDGAKLLKTNRQKFFYYVKSKKIRVKEGETERKSLYNYEDILKVKEELSIDESTPFVIDWVEPSDVLSTISLDMQVYQETLVGDINLYLSWVKKQPKLSIASFDADDRKRVLAYIAMMPLSEKTIIEILKGNRRETSITPDEIENYDREGAYTLLIESAVSHPDHPEQIGILMRHIMNYWCEQYPQRYIDKLYAQAASEKGDILIQKLYFAPLYDLANDAYMLDMKRPGASRIIRNFQKCLSEKSSVQQHQNALREVEMQKGENVTQEQENR